eukprot:2392476-Pleurochrysis_carterae.AAC.1
MVSFNKETEKEMWQTDAKPVLAKLKTIKPFAVVENKDALNEYATCYISCYTRISRNAKWPHVGVFLALYRAISNVRSKFETANTFWTH